MKRTSAKKWNAEIEDVCERFCGSRRRNLKTLTEVFPEIASEWCFAKNCSFEAHDFSHASSVKAWWSCKVCSQVYKASINHRTGPMKTGCPYCASKKVSEQNSLASLYPRLAEEFHTLRNKPITPSEITYASFKPIWWLCSNGHEWQARVADRSVHNTSCPYCLKIKRQNCRPKLRPRAQIILGEGGLIAESRSLNKNYQKNGSLEHFSPKVAALWHAVLNAPYKPSEFAPYSRVIAWWQCRQDEKHIWQQAIVRRIHSRVACPICFRQNSKSKRGNN